MAYKSNSSTTLKTNKVDRKNSWIVDFGASDHMTGDVTLIQNLTPCFENYSVKIADGSVSKVTSRGSVILLENLTLNSVLLVPNLDCNLLSIS